MATRFGSSSSSHGLSVLHDMRIVELTVLDKDVVHVFVATTKLGATSKDNFL